MTTNRKPGVAFYGKVRIPTIGHAKAIDTAKGIARRVGGDLHIGLSGTSHPLTPKTKKAHAEALFQHPVDTGDEHSKNLFSYLAHLHQHHDEIHLVAGSDRAPEYRRMLQDWNGKADRSGNVAFNFKKWKVHEVEGKREDVQKHPTQMSRDELERSVSATKLEGLARSGDYEGFRAYHPGMSEKHVRTVFNQIRMSSAEPPKKKSIKTIKEESFDEIGELNHEKFGPMLDGFVQFASKKLGIKSMPQMQLSKQEMTRSFGGYNPQNQSIVVVSKNRHPMDIFRTVAHELVHHKQKEDGRIGKNISQEGATGSPFENEANAEAGKLLRWYAKANPEMFKSGYVTEGMTTSGGIRGLGNVTGEVSPSTVSQYVLDNQGYEHPQLQDNTTDGLYTFTDNNWWMDKDNSKKYKSKFIDKIIKNTNTNNYRNMQEGMIVEGLYDPARHTVVFLMGASGSGKNFIGQQALSQHGLTELDPDTATKHLMKKQGLSLKMPPEEDFERNKARGRAKQVYNEKMRLAIANRQGLLINGTGDDPEKIIRIREQLHGLGYKSMMVFVHTSNKVSRQRNIERGEMGDRMVPEKIRQEKWERTQRAKPIYQQMFGPDFIHVDNNDDIRKITPERRSEIDAEHHQIFKTVRKFVSSPPDNPEANAWRAREMQRRGITQPAEQPRAFNMTTSVNQSSRLVREDKGSLSLKNWFDKSKSTDGKSGWVQVGGRYDGKPCARQEGQTTTPKCRSSSERASMTKKEREYAFKKKQREDPNQPEKSGAAKPTMVKTYKHQKESVQMDQKTIQEIKDACYHKVKARYKVFPSAYASGALVKCRKKGASNWGNKSKVDEAFESFMEEKDRTDTYKREWGTTSLTDMYKKDTPGQSEPKKKKLAKEENITAMGGATITRGVLPVSDGIGPMTTNYRPMVVSGYGNISESVLSWANNPATQQRFIAKYGDLAEQKLNEAAAKLSQTYEPLSKGPKSVEKIRESSYGAASYGKSPTDTMSPIGVQDKDNVTDMREDSLSQKKRYKATVKLAQEQSLMGAYMPRKADYLAKFPGVKGDPAKAAQYDKMRAIKHHDAQTYEAQHSPEKDIGGKTEPRARELEKQMNEGSAAWTRKEGKNPEGGLNRKGIESYRRENPGSKLSLAVTTPPSKLKPGSKKAKRRLSFCRRMKGMKAKLTSAKTARDPDSRINKSLRKWNCEE